MPRARQKEGLRYSGALAVTAAALAVRAAFPDALAQTPYLPAYFAVLVSSRYLGLGPSMLVCALSATGSALLAQANDLLRLVLFLAVSALMLWIVEVFRRARFDAELNARLAEERLAQLQIESAQRAQEERLSAQLRAIVESSEDAIISRDLDGVIQSWNRGAEQVFGYTAAEAIGRKLDLSGPDRVDEENDIMERIRRGGRVKHFETVRVRKDGKPIPVSLTISPIRGPGDAIVGVSQIARDIAERREFEDQLRQTQKLESLGVLAGGLAHDFNNLLTGIMGNASLAVSELEHPGQARERLSEILDASERAALLIRQMLAYSGKGRFLIERLDLSAQVREVLPLLGTSASKLIDIRTRLEERLPPIQADRLQMQQLIMNLALNAVEAIGDGPGIVTIATFHRDSAPPHQVILEVSDTGSGMTDEVKARMFDPFFTTKFTGRGLGLSAVMGIIKAHHGTIDVSSTPGSGTTVTVALPAASGEPPPAATSDSPDLRGEGLILVVDDEELVRKMATYTLERCGYTIETASNGRDALERFQTRPGDYAAILLDLTMPVMRGEDALRRIREIRPDVPVLLTSGYTESEAIHRFHDLGPSGFLQKPYTATALAHKIQQALRPAGR